jgi:hypothetical protein
MKNYILLIAFWLVSMGAIAQAQIASKRFPIDSSWFVQITKDLTNIDYLEKQSKKASNHDYELLDSIKYNYSTASVHSFKYNSFGDVIDDRFIYSTPYSWRRGEYKYNSNRKLTDMIIYNSYDTTTNSWVPEAKVHYFYNSNGLLKRYVWWFYYNTWGNEYGEFLYYYNAQNRLIKKQLNFNTTGTMKPDTKYLYHYNSNNDLVLDRTYHWHSNSWVLRKKKLRNYLKKGLLDWKEELDYDENTGSLNDGYREVYYRDSKDSLIQSKVFWYNPTTMQLSSLWLERTVYNKFSKPLKMYHKSDTTIYVRVDYTYDGFGNKLSYKGFMKDSYYNFNIGSWRDTILLVGYETYVYDYNHNIDEVIYPNYYVFNTDINTEANNMQNFYQSSTWFYDYTANYPPIASSQFCIYYYSKKTIVDIDDIKYTKVIKVYPNPAHAYLQIDGLSRKQGNTISIYDIQGKLILEANLSISARINIQDLKRGMYIYKVRDAENAYTGKLIVE